MSRSALFARPAIFGGLIVLTLTALGPAPAHAEPVAYRYDARRPYDLGRRHEGFYLRLMPTVFGLGGALRDDIAENAGLGGGGFSLDIAVGGNIVPGFILFAELTGLVAGMGVNYDDPIRGNRDTAATSGGLGIGAAGYFRSNVYLSGSIGVAGIEFFTNEEDLDERIRSNAGFYLKFAVGKEWWVSRRWGLGLAGVITYRRFTLEPDGFWVRGEGIADFWTIGPAFTASFD